MNMKRGLVFTLCSLAVAAMASSAMAQATVNLSLNLRYNDPADPSEGGTWYLLANTTDPDGIAAVSAYLSNITAPTASNANDAVENGNDTALGGYSVVTSATLAAMLDTEGDAFATAVTGGINIVYAQDTANGPIVAAVGRGSGTPGNLAADPLKNAAWNNSAILLTGTFTGTRPAFVTAGANSTDANTLNGTALGQAAADANVTTVVRGDSERSLNLEGVNEGLYSGDANRDGTVNAADLALLLANYDGTGKSWEQGNFNNTAGGANTVVNAADLALLLANYDKVANPISVAAIPEPHSLVLALGGLAAVFAARRRS
jgi:hypothetical protein